MVVNQRCREGSVAQFTGKFSLKVLHEVDRQQHHRPVTGMFEHPEDLGRVNMPHAFGSPSPVPASVWRFPEITVLIQNGWWCGAFLQCAYDAPTAKPTRCISNSKQFLKIAPNAMPTFDQAGYYLGPTEKCTHRHTESLVRKAGQTGVFRSQAAAAYPPLLCKAFADSLYFGLLAFTTTPSEGDVSTVALKERVVEVRSPAAPRTAPEDPHTPARRVKMRTDLSTPTKVSLVPRSVVDGGILDAESKSIPQSAASVKPKWELQEGIDYVRAGWWGRGDHIKTHKSPGKPGRPLQDGGGLCCPGRWVPSRRNLPPKAIMLTALMDRWLDEKAGSSGEKFFEGICFSVLSGNCKADPFAEQLGDLKLRVSKLLANEGLSRPEGSWTKGQEIDFGFMFMLGAWFKDPDHQAMAEFCQGVRVGVGVELPRTPAVWPSKKKWPLGEYGEDPVSELNANYPSAREHRVALLAELKEQEDRGWVLPMTLKAAQTRFGEVCVAPLAVIEEKSGQTRTLHDASNGVQVNHRIKVQDAEQCPSALDVQAAITACDSLYMPIISLVVDVSKAHRRVPLDQRDWGLVACSPDDAGRSRGKRQLESLREHCRDVRCGFGVLAVGQSGLAVSTSGVLHVWAGFLVQIR